MFEVKMVDVFEKHFPKVCEKPSIQPHKEEIRLITMAVVKDMLGLNDRTRHQAEMAELSEAMPYHEEL
jgi:hypothetical protein